MESEDLTVPFLIGAAAGLGYLAWRSYDKRQQFRTELRGALAQRSVELIVADLGRGPVGEPVWYLTVRRPYAGVAALRAPLAHDVDPYSGAVLANLVSRIDAWILARSA